MTARPGFTLAELMVALALFGALLVTTLGFYRQQGTAFTEGNRRMSVMQNLRYGVNSLEQHIRTAGTGVPSDQPVLVYADTSVIAFNANYATNIENDVLAVYYDFRLADDEVSALTPARKFTLPHSSFAYPDSAYYYGSGNSPAETIIFYFEADATTARTDDYILWRQVNDTEPAIVARRILETDNPFFTYYVLDEDASGSPISEFPASQLPIAHTIPLHGDPADTALIGAVDSVRAVRVNYAATNGLSGSAEAVREITRLIRIPNAGLASEPNCGNEPILGTSLSATGVAPTETTSGHIELTWSPATDESSGEQDVLRYVIWRRTGTSGDWGDPLVSVAPGSTSYIHDDYTAAENIAYDYALAAQDCTPSYSALATSGSVMWSGS